MPLDYKNPNDWGKSPLTDNALRLQQFRAENPEAWAKMIQDDLKTLATIKSDGKRVPNYSVPINAN